MTINKSFTNRKNTGIYATFKRLENLIKKVFLYESNENPSIHVHFVSRPGNTHDDND